MDITYYLRFILPVLALSYVIWFFLGYVKEMRPRAGTLEWIAAEEKPRFSLISPRAPMRKNDWTLLLGLTLIYAAVAFFGLGNTWSPQSSWRPAQAQTVTVDFGREVLLSRVDYFPLLGVGQYTFSLSADGQTWTDYAPIEQDYVSMLKWKSYDPQALTPARYMKITAQNPKMWLGELGVYEERAGGGALISADQFSLSGGGEALFDEQWMAPAEGQTYLNSSYFDEIYHARTAYEHINNVYPYEITHPPLGKLILSLGIRLFGMTPFGWRFMGVLFGVLMLPFLYILLKGLFKKSLVAFLGTSLFAFDFMHFVQTRIATIDVYTVFFILLMYLFMWFYFTSGPEAPFKKTVAPLFLSGFFFGVGCVVKWPCIYAGAGLLALYVIYLIMRGRHAAGRGELRDYWKFLFKTLLCSLVFFIVIPAAIYALSYIPYAKAAGHFNLAGVLDEMWRNQVYMFNYHTGLNDTHPYQAAWYTWLGDIRPILYYYKSTGEGMVSAFGAFGNPFLWWGGLLSLGMVVWRFLKRRDAAGLFIIVGFLSQFLPWVLVTRITFIYHYFPSTLFLCLAMGYVFNDLIDRMRSGRRLVVIYTAISAAAFFLFYPVLSGLSVPTWYSYLVQWLPSWPF